ncbi:MAG: alpha/beta hydrolase fold domain-containing protein [Lachnospiraceae bacterium]|nr:alpha/beta hydrolase fold domain-containing protein [Lachnospiraceae bacterium]
MKKRLLGKTVSRSIAALTAFAMILGSSPADIMAGTEIEIETDITAPDDPVPDGSVYDIMTEDEPSLLPDDGLTPSDNGAAEEILRESQDDALLNDGEFEVVIHDFDTDTSKGIPAKNELEVGNAFEVGYEIIPASKADSVDITVTSSNHSIAAIGTETANKNKVFPWKYGTVTLTVTATDKEDNTRQASADITVTCVYPVEKFFHIYDSNIRFAFSKTALYPEGWLTYDGSKYLTGKIEEKNNKIYYFKESAAFPGPDDDDPELILDGTSYLFDPDTCELKKEWVKITGIEMGHVPAEDTGIDEDTMPYGTSCTLTATVSPVNANDSFDPEWVSSDPSVVKVTPLGYKNNEIYARIDVIKKTEDPDTPVTISLTAGEGTNRKAWPGASIDIYTRCPVGWFRISGDSYYGMIKDSSEDPASIKNKVEPVKNTEQTIDGRTYCFDQNGVMVKGVLDTGSKIKDYGENGALRATYEKRGFVPLPEGTIYFDEDNNRVLGEIVYDADGNGYYTDPANGYLMKGYFSDSGNNYYALPADDEKTGEKAGRLQSGWVFAGDKWRLFAGSGAAVPYSEISSSSPDHWIQLKDGSGRYYRLPGGKLLSGWQTIDGNRYYFGKDGRVASGWQSIGGKVYYFGVTDDWDYDENRKKATDDLGVMFTGRREIGGKNYLFNSKGVRQTGWQTFDNGKYYFDTKADENGVAGRMAVGVTLIGSAKYYFREINNDDMGVLLTGYASAEDAGGILRQYYAKDNGVLLLGWQKVGTGYEFFDYKLGYKIEESDDFTPGWFDTVDNGHSYRYYFKKADSPVTGLQTIDGEKYYFDPVTARMVTGVCKIGNNKYVFDDNDGHMLKGYVGSGGAMYFTNDRGIMQYGYLSAGGGMHYFLTDPDSPDHGKEQGLVEVEGPAGFCSTEGGSIIFIKNGKLQKGWQTVDNRKYYFGDHGILKTGEFLIKKDTYRTYTAEEAQSAGHPGWIGSARTGSVNDSDGTRYYDRNGKRKNGWVSIDDGWFYFDPSDGLMLKGLFTAGNKTYYTDPLTGKRQTGQVAACERFFDNSGVMRTGWKTINGEKYYYAPDTGILRKGVFRIGGIMYLFDETDGHMHKGGYIPVNSVRYLTDKTGRLMTGWQLVNDAGLTKWHYFDTASGKELYYDGSTNEIGLLPPETIDGVLWYTAENLPDGNKTVRARFAFKNNKPLKGWKTINGNRYYFEENGRLVTGFRTINKARYYFDESSEAGIAKEGAMLKNGIQNIVGSYYFLQPSGACRTGWFDTADGRYYADPLTGELAVSFAKIGDNIYYFSDSAATIGCMQTGFIKISENDRLFYDDPAGSKGASNTYYADEKGVIVTSGWRNIKSDPKVKDSQEWSFYFAPNRPYINTGDFILTGEMAVGDVLIDDNGIISAYLDDGTGPNDGFGSGGDTRLYDECGVMQLPSGQITDIGHYYRFNHETGARRKEVLYFYGNYYGLPIDEKQAAVISSISRYTDSGMNFGSESGDFITVNGNSSGVLAAKGLTTYPAATFPMCASKNVPDEQEKYVAGNDLNSDDNVDVLDVEIYSKDVYDKAIAKYGPRNLVLAGASSGAGICLSLYDHALNKNEPNKLPSQLLLISPWIDVRMSNPACSSLTKSQMGSTDVATLKYWGARYIRDGEYTDENGVKPYAGCAGERDNPFASPVLYDNSRMRNVIIYSGTFDPCYFDCALFAENAKNAGNDGVILNEYKKEQHGFVFSKNSSASKKVILDFCRNIMTQ